MITIPHATEAIRMQAFQIHTDAQPISIQPLQTQQKPRVTEVQHNAEKHYLLELCFSNLASPTFLNYLTYVIIGSIHQRFFNFRMNTN